MTSMNSHPAVLLQDRTDEPEARPQPDHDRICDPVTGLPDGRFLPERLSRLLHSKKHGSGASAALLLLDLDRFRNVNNSYGHAAGDILLAETAQRLLELAPEGAALYRYSADEFYIILPNVEQPSELQQLANRIIASVRKPFFLMDSSIYITASVGASLFPHDGRDADELIGATCLAMRKAKERGGGSFQLYLPEMGQEMKISFQLEKELRSALENGLMELYYQPFVHVADGRLCGLEALLRWNHPVHGMLLPSRFIHAAEESGLIVPIGSWVLEEACRQFGEWAQMGYGDMLLSVNVSVLQMLQPGFIQHVRSVVRKSGMDPRLLQLELTESISPGNNPVIEEAMMRLREMNIRIAVDDFGTGYTSLTTLKRFPVQTLKLDRSLVQHADKDEDSGAIMTALITLCRRLGVRSLAEGVETPEQHAFLRKIGCQTAQGFLYCSPLPVHEITVILQKERRLVPARS